MTKFMLEIELENDAMRSTSQLSKKLEEVAKDVKSTAPTDLGATMTRRIRDDNGNTVGFWRIVEE